MKKLISHGAVLKNINIDALIKEAREEQMLNASIKVYMANGMSQATSAAAKAGYVYDSMPQLVTPVSGGHLYAMHQALNMGDQNILVFL